MGLSASSISLQVLVATVSISKVNEDESLAAGILFIDKDRYHYDYAENSDHRNYYSEFASVTQHFKVQSSRYRNS